MKINPDLIKDALNDEMYFKPGETFEFGNSSLYMSSIVSSGSSTVYSSVILPKRLDKINTITINEFEVVFRNNQGYFRSDKNTASNDTAHFTLKTLPDSYVQKANGTILRFAFRESGVPFTDGSGNKITNNTPVAAEIVSLKLTFN